MSEKTATSYRHADFRYWYQMPCCDVNVGVLDDAKQFDCCACGARCFQRDCRVTVQEKVNQ
jgi:hypothetical protein